MGFAIVVPVASTSRPNEIAAESLRMVRHDGRAVAKVTPTVRAFCHTVSAG
jgi:hypothetical protein